MIGISNREHTSNEYVWQLVNILASHQELLLLTAKRRNLSWFGHVCRHDTQAEIILRGIVDSSRRIGKPLKSWMNNIKEWTCQSLSSLLRIADDISRWATIAARRLSIGVPQRGLGVSGISVF